MATRDTRDRILEAALAQFRERGFGEATMREIASKAGVAVGLAYYYFDSKDAIVHAFYQRAKDELPAVLARAHEERQLTARLRAMIEAKLEYFEPNRRFLGALMPHAADPSSPLSPFSEDSRAVREADIGHFERALVETGTAVSKDLAPHMPKILWFYQMGIILFWIYDRSPRQQRTRELITASLAVVVPLIKLARTPLMRPARKSVLRILEILQA